MKTLPKLSPEDERSCDCLAPYVRRACNSSPSPAVLAAIHAAAETKNRRRPRSLRFPFIRFAAAAAALLVMTMAGWLLVRENTAAQTCRQAALMDDMLFLCADNQGAPEMASGGKREELARRLLNLQGLDAVAAPSAEMSAEPPSPLSRDPQSRNTPALQAQRCG